MGSVSTHHGTELSLALEELGVTSGFCKVVRKAAGGTVFGEKLTWFILEVTHPHDELNGERYIALARTSRNPNKYGVWCRIDTEHVGPCFYNVPDSIWDNRPEVGASEYARGWRDAVAAYKAAWPLTLDKVPVGADVNIEGHRNVWTRVAGDWKGAPLFRGNSQGHYYSSTRFTGWKGLRAKLAGSVVVGATLTMSDQPEGTQ
jgi:hypothetical protein